MKTKFILIGYGWRAKFFHRIAKEIPSLFEISAIVVRTEESVEKLKKEEDIFCTTDLDDALATAPDFAVVCVPRTVMTDYLENLMQRGVPALCETPPSQNTEELKKLWALKNKYEGKIQVAEQYFLQPLYATILKIVEKGMIGEVSNMSLSALHGYHATSIFRKVLGVGFENCKISGKKFIIPAVLTNGRDGLDRRGEVVNTERNVLTLEFESGKVAFFDFVNHQYFSHIRTRRLNVQGQLGEINDMDVRYVYNKGKSEAYPNGEFIPVLETMNRIDYGPYDNDTPTHEGIMLGKEFFYENPFYGARLNDDEIAMADCLVRMKKYVDTGVEFYPLEDAIQDTYLSFLMDQALSSGEEVVSENILDLKDGKYNF